MTSATGQPAAASQGSTLLASTAASALLLRAVTFCPWHVVGHDSDMVWVSGSYLRAKAGRRQRQVTCMLAHAHLISLRLD